MFKNNQTTNFKKGKIPRNELELPTLNFVVVDQWIDIVGEKAIFSWLRMYSWCKRDEESDNDLWEQAKIPSSFSKIMKRLGVGKDTFYNKILKPLWDVGLIDIEEYRESSSEGNKPMNVIVYKYPQNNKSLAHQELKKIRNYNKDYHSQAKTFGQKGGRPKNDNNHVEDGSEIEPGSGVVLKQNGGWFSNRTEGGSQIEPINNLNTNNNSLNNINNNFNEKQEEEEEETNNFFYDALITFLKSKQIDPETIKHTIKKLIDKNIDTFSMNDIEGQYKHMMDKLTYEEVDNHNSFSTYFANGLKMRSVQTKSNRYHQKEVQNYLGEQRENVKKRDTSVYFNWIEENNQ